MPRIVSRETWDPIERGLKQRVEALNLFIDDVYHDRKIVRDGIVPADIVESSEGYRTECIGLDPPQGVWCHITGTDLVRDAGRHNLRPGRQPPLPLRRLLRARETAPS